MLKATLAVKGLDITRRFERLLKDEEGHVDWLEAQLHLISEVGYERYLSQHIGDDE